MVATDDVEQEEGDDDDDGDGDDYGDEDDDEVWVLLFLCQRPLCMIQLYFLQRFVP